MTGAVDPATLAGREDVQGRQMRRTVERGRFEEMQGRISDGLTWGVGAITVDDRGRVLLVEQHGKWYVPGGEVESGESLREALVREVAEETGVDIAIERPVAVTRVTLEHGGSETAFDFAHFTASPETTDLTSDPGVTDEEITAVRWASSLPEATVDRDLVLQYATDSHN